MAVSILVCGCGLKIRAAGATPGRLGRCPKCGGELRVPDVEQPPGGNPFAERRATMGELRVPDFVPPPEPGPNRQGRLRSCRRRRLWSQTVQRTRRSQKERTAPAVRHHASAHRLHRKEIRVAHDRRHPAPVETNRDIMVRQHPLSAPKRGQPGRDRLAHGDPLALHDPRAGVLPRPDGRRRSTWARPRSAS